MSWETSIDGRLHTALGERVVHNGSVWIHETYIQGRHPQIGSLKEGLEGEVETVRKILLPLSLVDSRIKVNGKSNASYTHLVIDEHKHLLEHPQAEPAHELTVGITAAVAPSVPTDRMLDIPLPVLPFLIQSANLQPVPTS